MKLFKRSPHAASTTDEYLTYFTSTQARDFRRLVGTSFAVVGRDVTVYTDHVEDRSGTTFGLWNIGALCAGADRRDWPDLIDEHVRAVTTPPMELENLSSDAFETGLYLRVADVSTVPNLDQLGYAREIAPGLLEVLSVDLPDSVATPSGEELQGWGPLSKLLALGRGNLRALLESGSVAAETGEGRGRFTSVTGDSFFTASLALILPEVLAQFTGEDDFGRGVLVAIPHRHQLLYRLIDGPDAGLGLDRMFAIARPGYYDGSGPLSPHVYRVHHNRWTQVTSIERGRPRVHMADKLGEALEPFE
jgi:hypothetical protein